MEDLQTKSEETITIDSDGDVHLIIGSDDIKPPTNLFVSSKVLSLASPVFAAMLGPHFSEGNSLAASGMCDIPLPEDDPEAMTLLCNCLHFRSRDVPLTLPFSLLKSLALACDKYDTTKAMRPWTILWLREWETKRCEEGFEGLLAVIYALDCPEAFQKLTKTAILDQVGSFDDKRIPDGFDMIPDDLLADLEVRRVDIKERLQRCIEMLIDPFLGTQFSCYNRFQVTHAYLTTLRNESLWPLSEAFRNSSLSTLTLRTSRLTEPVISMNRDCNCTKCKKHLLPSLSTQRDAQLRSVVGFCLDCVKGAKGDKKRKDESGACRIEHS